MENSSPVYKKAHELAEKAAAIRVGLPAGVYGTNSPSKKAAQDLLKSCSVLVQTVAGKGPKKAVLDALDAVVQSVETCFLLGVFSENELKKYQDLIEGIDAELDKEK